MGEAVYRPSQPTAQDGLPRAVAHFAGGLSDRDIGALVGLRNSLAHDYGLTAQGKDALRRHMFLLRGDGPLVEHASHPWDRDWTADPSAYSTSINVLALSDLAEGVVQAVGRAWWSGDLATDLAGGLDELLVRFHFVTRV